jgi:hypothetical protein
MFPITTEGEFCDHVIGTRNIAQKLPSAGIEIGQTGANNGATPQEFQIAREAKDGCN